MEVNSIEAVEQAARFERHDGYFSGSNPEAKQWRERFVGAIIQACTHCNVNPTELVNQLIELPRVPSDAQLIAAARGIRGVETFEPAKVLRCERCNDTGWDARSGGGNRTMRSGRHSAPIRRTRSWCIS